MLYVDIHVPDLKFASQWPIYFTQYEYEGEYRSSLTDDVAASFIENIGTMKISDMNIEQTLCRNPFQMYQ